jgi:hypothetical protein
MSLIDHGRSAACRPDTHATAARHTRLEMYAQWLADDVDGIRSNLDRTAGLPGTTALLAEIREQVALTLCRIDRAIQADRDASAQQEQEPA